MGGSSSDENSLQTVFVTVTIMSQCSLLVAPGQLNFASVYQQGTPALKAINVAASSGCNMPVSWSAVSNASWLTIDTTSGQTPASPNVGINVAGLLPGVYNSSLVFSFASGTQTLSVTFTLSQTTVPLMTTAPGTLSFSGVVGQSPAMQNISIVNSGDSGTLNWTATATSGGWLTVYPATGILMAHQSSFFNVTASILSTLAPGSYKGTVTVTGTDGNGHPASGSPQLIPVSLLPSQYGMAGSTYAVTAIVLGAAYLMASILFAWNETRMSARRLLWTSLIYLPVLLLILTWDHLRLLEQL